MFPLCRFAEAAELFGRFLESGEGFLAVQGFGIAPGVRFDSPTCHSHYTSPVPRRSTECGKTTRTSL